jgi:hypothetical protein
MVLMSSIKSTSGAHNLLGYADQGMELLTVGRPNMNTDREKVDVVEQEVKDSLSEHARNVHTLCNISVVPHCASELDQNLTAITGFSLF